MSGSSLVAPFAGMSLAGAQDAPSVQNTAPPATAAGELERRVVRHVCTRGEAEALGIPNPLCVDEIVTLIASYSVGWEVVCDARGDLNGLHPFFRGGALASGLATLNPPLSVYNEQLSLR